MGPNWNHESKAGQPSYILSRVELLGRSNVTLNVVMGAVDVLQAK